MYLAGIWDMLQEIQSKMGLVDPNHGEPQNSVNLDLIHLIRNELPNILK